MLPGIGRKSRPPGIISSTDVVVEFGNSTEHVRRSTSPPRLKVRVKETAVRSSPSRMTSTPAPRSCGSGDSAADTVAAEAFHGSGDVESCTRPHAREMKVRGFKKTMRARVSWQQGRCWSR
eukprot:4353751-Pleurochrysis_carterae.AAC.2